MRDAEPGGDPGGGDGQADQVEGPAAVRGRVGRDGLVRRTAYPAVPAQADYRLTETGAGLTHLVKALADWSLAHRGAIAGARAAYDLEHPGHEIR